MGSHGPSRLMNYRPDLLISEDLLEDPQLGWGVARDSSHVRTHIAHVTVAVAPMGIEPHSTGVDVEHATPAQAHVVVAQDRRPRYRVAERNGDVHQSLIEPRRAVMVIWVPGNIVVSARQLVPRTRPRERRQPGAERRLPADANRVNLLEVTARVSGSILEEDVVPASNVGPGMGDLELESVVSRVTGRRLKGRKRSRIRAVTVTAGIDLAREIGGSVHLDQASFLDARRT